MERAGRLFGKLKFAPEVADPEVRVRAAWAVAAGKKIARHTRAVSLVRDSLIVEVEDYIWQQQLARVERFLVSNLAKELGEVLVKSIDFRPMPRRREPQRAESARPASGLTTGEVQDPILDVLYRQSRVRQTGKR
jgi:predicted nucleic acid-binding Zn ribbon protein